MGLSNVYLLYLVLNSINKTACFKNYIINFRKIILFVATTKHVISCLRLNKLTLSPKHKKYTILAMGSLHVCLFAFVVLKKKPNNFT